MKQFWMVVLAVLSSPVLAQTSRPHIITIVLDDLGWHDVGYHGTNQIKTPNIDALAYSGMILNRHYTLPSCTPSRTALLTGRYPIRTGMQGYPLYAGENRSLPLSFKLKPAYLKDLGYKTHMVGKWHLGYQTFRHVPNNRGFDTFFGYYNGYIDYDTYCYNQFEFSGYDMHLNNNAYWTEPEYATRLFTKRAKEIIQKHNASEPLYLFLSHLAPHVGNKNFLALQVPKDSDVNKTYAHIKHYARRLFAGCLEELDKSIGIIVQELKIKGLLENSIITLMSDNGGGTVSADMAPNWSSNWPFAGTKFTMFEGGVHCMAIVWSPLLPKGVINNGVFHISDWLPTLYSAAGGDVSDLGEIDGIDHWEALKNLKTVKRDNLLLNIDDRINAEGIIIDERWKVLIGGYPNYGFYDFHWGEEQNVAPNPEYNPINVFNSQTGKVIQTIPNYEDVLEPKRMMELREKLTLTCKGPINHNVESYVYKSSEMRCPDFCVFDIINDPCELTKVENKSVLERAKNLFRAYKAQMVRQKPNGVDPKSNPAFFGNVWMPWDSEQCAKSRAEVLSSQYLSVFLLTLTWCFLRGREYRT